MKMNVVWTFDGGDRSALRMTQIGTNEGTNRDETRREQQLETGERKWEDV
jgi:hypothetical protein